MYSLDPYSSSPLASLSVSARWHDSNRHPPRPLIRREARGGIGCGRVSVLVRGLHELPHRCPRDATRGGPAPTPRLRTHARPHTSRRAEREMAMVRLVVFFPFVGQLSIDLFSYLLAPVYTHSPSHLLCFGRSFSLAILLPLTDYDAYNHELGSPHRRRLIYRWTRTPRHAPRPIHS